MLVPTLAVEPPSARPDVDLGPPASSMTQWRGPDGLVCARGQVHAGGAWVELPGVARYWLRAHSSFVRAAPLDSSDAQAVVQGFTRTALPFLLQLRGVQCLHASAVTTPSGIVAFCGHSGVGKSTLAAALDRLGYDVWADDAVAFSCPTGGRPISVQLPYALRLSRSSVRLLAPFPPEGRASHPRTGRQRPIAGLFVLERTDHGGPTFDRLSPAAAFATVVEHCYSFSLGELEARRRFSENQLGLVTTVPVVKMGFAPAAQPYRSLVAQVAGQMQQL